MRKMMIFVTLFVCSFFLMYNVSAASYTARAYINSSCNVRTGPGTQNKKISSAYIGSYYNLVEDKTYTDTNNHYDCNSDWYQIYYNGTATGYVCGDHVDVVRSYSTDDVAPSTTCEQEMSNLGFPSSYWGGLCALKERHPNWQFVPLKINYDWSYIIEKESPCGVNLIYGSSENAGFIDSTCNSYDSGYVGINQTGVAYYMDPRNFLSDRFIFQFQAQNYDNNFASSYVTAVTNIIGGSSFYKYHLNAGTNLAEVINSNATTLNVSPIFAASRMLQELGNSDSLYSLYSGSYTADPNTTYGQKFIELTGSATAYQGYYNFYNFGVSDSCVQSYGTAYCGLNYAYRQGWNSVNAAIQGGLSQIANNYIGAGQHTGYLQKFNVNQSNPSDIATHQYMTNIAAPSSESATNYKTYSDLGILESAFIFHIPVFNNMDATISNSPGGAVDGGEDNPPSSLPISTIVTSSGYRYAAGYISGIALGTDASTVKSTLESVGGSGTVTIYNASGSVVNSGTIATSYKVVINNSSSVETLEVIIKGDTSGDGIVNALDLLQVQKNILGTYNLSGAYWQAGDTSSDGAINALDLLQVQKNILGTYSIVQ
ncbi:MAG TPA: SH3 domain-containing protein [Candidatus Onthocola stercoravium]|nr:SH3 domain-containing protein [Candidatus Onthocola stercoravium]